MTTRTRTRLVACFALLMASGTFVTAGHPQAGAGQVPARPASPPADIRKGGGFILGRAIDVGTGRPVAGALVTLTVFGAAGPGGGRGAQPASGQGGASSLNVLTNGDGYFFFRDLPGGRFSIAASAMGYLNGGYLQNKPSGAVQPIDLGENEKRGDVQIKMWKYGAISGTVLDEAGEPAVGATVRLLRRGGRLFNPGPTELTDDRGSYRFGGLIPGEFVAGIITTQSTIPASLYETYLDVQASDPGRFAALSADLRNNGVPALNTGARIGDQIFPLTGLARVGYTPPPPAEDGRMLAYLTTFFQNAPTIGEASTITLGSGEERTGVDLSIRLVPTVKVSGTLTGPDGPARNMGLSLSPAGSDLMIDPATLQAATTATDQNGAFTFLAVPAGTYTLKSARTAVIRTGPTALPLLWAAQPVTVDRADLTGLNVVLRPGLVMSGHLEFAGTKPAPTGQEFQRFNVMLAQATSGYYPRPSMALVATDGTFATAGDLPGRYLATTIAPTGWFLRSAKCNGRNIADESVDLTSSDLADVVFTFADAAAKVTGTIVDDKGAPDPQADAIIFPADFDGWRRGDLNARRMILNAATRSGSFGFSALPAGQYYVVAVDDSVAGQWTDPRFLERLIAGATKLTIVEGEERTLALKTFVVR